MKRWLGVFLVALLALPVTSAEEIDETISLDVDSDEAVLRFISTLTGNDAVEMRTEIDEDNGNGDGIVTMDEVARYNAESTMKFETDAPECFRDFDLATIDGLRPKRLSQLSGRVEGAQGPLSSTAPIRTTGDFTLLYATARGSTHSVQISYSKMDDFGMSMGCYFDKWSDAFSGPGNFGGDAQSVWGAYSTVPWNLPFGAARILGLLEPTSISPAQNQPSRGDDGDPELLLIQPRVGHSIDPNSIQPPEIRPLWDGRAIRADTPSEQTLLFTTPATFTISSRASNSIPGSVQDVGAYIGFAVLGSGSLLILAALATEFGRFHVWKLLFLIPGFTRLDKDEVLEHTKRDELYRFIKQTPGPSFSDLRRELGLSNGTLVHHLRILEAQEFVKAFRDGFRTRFYVRGPKVVVESYLTRTQQQLVDTIGANPGLTQKELAQLLGLPRESISYHAKQLAAKGRLLVKQDGKWRRYWPPTPTPARS